MPAMGICRVQEVELGPLKGAHGCCDGLGSGGLHGGGACSEKPAGKECLGDHTDGRCVAIDGGDDGELSARCL